MHKTYLNSEDEFNTNSTLTTYSLAEYEGDGGVYADDSEYLADASDLTTAESTILAMTDDPDTRHAIMCQASTRVGRARFVGAFILRSQDGDDISDLLITPEMGAWTDNVTGYVLVEAWPVESPLSSRTS